MKIILNGKEQEIDKVETLYDLLTRLNLVDKPVAVELNYNVVSKKDFQYKKLSQGDRVEVVQFVGGG